MTTVICQQCKQPFDVQYPVTTRPRKYCAHKCANDARKGKQHPTIQGKNHPHWIGGKVTSNWGYTYVLNPDRAERGKTGLQNYIAEHRLVMERMLGRKLFRYEIVHHKNGIKTDNRPKNLELWVSGHPRGQRPEDVPHCPTCTCNQQTKT